MAIPVIALLIASVCGLIQLVLTYQVIKHRRREQAATGAPVSQALERAIRAHGNFVEVTPIFLILLILLEMVDSYLWWVAGLGACFVIGRVLHARSMLVDEGADPPVFKNRVRGMVLTLISLGLAVVSGPVWVVWSLIG
jgi:uncharacterized membrane protein YecN with MAPEG domain